MRNENTSLLTSKERGIISTEIGKASVDDKMNSQDKCLAVLLLPNTELRRTLSLFFGYQILELTDWLSY